MANYPEGFSVYIEWDFEAELDDEYSSLIAQSHKLRKEIDNEVPWHDPYKLYKKFVRTNLNKSIGFSSVNIKYEYSEETPNGGWIDHEKVLEITQEENITFGQILYKLHHFTGKNLHAQDIMAIEGFELEESSSNEAIPTYYVFFGS